MSFWHHEVEEELTSLGVRKKWTFCKEAGDLSGTFDTAMEMVDKIRCEQLYYPNDIAKLEALVVIICCNT